MNARAVICFSEHEPAVEVADLAELDRVATLIAESCPVDRPTIVDLRVHGHSVMFGLGLPETFVQVQSESGMPPYFITVGDPGAEGVVTYWLMGRHHTEIPRRYHVSSAVAREIVGEFFATAVKSTRVGWEEV